MKNKRTFMFPLTRSGGARWAAALLAGVTTILAVPAAAGTIGISNGVLIAGAEPGDGNQVFEPTVAGLNLILPHLSFAIVTPGCSMNGVDIVCPLAGFHELVILGGDGDDVIQLSGIPVLTFAIQAVGGKGDDVLVGTPGNVKLFGGPGDDVIISMAGNCFSRGTGADLVFGGGCDAGTEPGITPLARDDAETPEPAGLWLAGSGLVGLIVSKRRRLKVSPVASDV